MAIFCGHGPLQRRLDNVGHVAVRGVQVLLGNELLDGVDGNGLIHGAAGTGVLAPPVADAPQTAGKGFSFLISASASR